MISSQAVTELFDSLFDGLILRTFVQYLITFYSWLEASVHVISRRFMRQSIVDKTEIWWYSVKPFICEHTDIHRLARLGRIGSSWWRHFGLKCKYCRMLQAVKFCRSFGSFWQIKSAIIMQYTGNQQDAIFEAKNVKRFAEHKMKHLNQPFQDCFAFSKSLE